MDIKCGFSFGTDQELCDVLLGKPGLVGISGIHFYINFDEEGRVVLFDESDSGTSVSYKGWGKKMKLRHFPWIIPLESEIEVYLPYGLTFEIILATHDSCEAGYRSKFKSYLEGRIDSVFSVGRLEPRTLPLPSGQFPIYLPDDVLKSGGFGQSSFDEAEIHGYLMAFRNLSHKHIVQFVNFLEKPKPWLIMEFLPLGSLRDMDKEDSITEVEVRKLLFQASLALYRKAPFHIKLTDFGLSKYGPLLQTICGTKLYNPPEVPSINERCDWDPCKRQNYQRVFGTVSGLVDSAPDDPLLPLVARMLQENPSNRPSASDCFQEALAIHQSYGDDEFGTNSSSCSIASATHGVHSRQARKRRLSSTESCGYRAKRSRTSTLEYRTSILQYRATVIRTLKTFQDYGILEMDDDDNNSDIQEAINILADGFARAKITDVDVTRYGSNAVAITLRYGNENSSYLPGSSSNISETSAQLSGTSHGFDEMDIDVEDPPSSFATTLSDGLSFSSVPTVASWSSAATSRTSLYFLSGSQEKYESSTSGQLSGWEHYAPTWEDEL
ncbi:serine/threonine protein kinase [Polytolypa hystricis UAMH7299]|uniref:Serine/threonine protein kinase n=1 Tax=Polytolypa hystricis (strain UAMH7299) TaxID=1447883 RepID=A0A2B7XYI1_POLH7|nr:serine/threonine protein kinase [Polytolypa hystricis UAMH7299]